MFLSKKPYTFQIDIFINAFKFILFVHLLNENCKFCYNKSYNCWYIKLWVYFCKFIRHSEDSNLHT